MNPALSGDGDVIVTRSRSRSNGAGACRSRTRTETGHRSGDKNGKLRPGVISGLGLQTLVLKILILPSPVGLETTYVMLMYLFHIILIFNF
jgi:hypothetical protein